tara:strand:- start:2000 stop:2731 length:732 start_codon:yes stop_codon:yes gene_type:complete
MPTMSLLLGSGGIATDERREIYRKMVSEHFSGFSEVLFIPFASHDHDAYTSRMQQFLGDEGPNLVAIDPSNPLESVMGMDAIYVGGGNSFLLVKELHERGLIEPIRERVTSGAPYLGVSAGSNVACPTIMTTNDMPIALPPNFSSIGLVPFQINPHFHPGRIRFLDGEKLVEHFGETRPQRISEFHKVSDTPVLGMWEGSFVNWDGSRGVLTGRATAFFQGQAAIDLNDGDVFDSGLVRSDQS